MIILRKYFWLSLIFIINANADEYLGGKPFTDPTSQVKMPQKWIAQPIQYKKWAKNAALAVTLDQQLYPALLPAIQQYARQNKLDIAVQEGTCGISAHALKKKIVDITGFCCPPGKNDRLPGVKFHTLGIAAIALLVHPTNPIHNVSFEQTQQIFQGYIFRWSNIDKRASRRIIQVIGRMHCKQRPGHWRLLLDNEDLFSPRMLEVSTIPDMISEVAFDRYALGYETLWMIRLNQRRGKVKILSINQVDPRNNTKLIAGAYPIYRTYNLTTWKSPKNRQAQRLVQYLIEYMEEMDPKYGIVPVSKLRKAGWKFRENELIGEPR